MLKELLIKDFAIINEVNIQFTDKMTAMTGETGAGKSIIIDALGLLTGGRGSIEFIKTGSEKAVIQGLFDISKNGKVINYLKEVDIKNEDSMLVLTREFSRNGRNVCRANGMLISLSTLHEIGAMLVNIHGQNQNQALLNEDNHIDILDRFADSKLEKIKQDYFSLYIKIKEKKSKLRNIQKNAQEIAQRKDMLIFQLGEIEEANLKIGEEEELIDFKNKLANYDKISQALTDSYEQLSQKIIDSTGIVMNNLNTISDLSKEVKDVSDIVSDSFFSLQDATITIRDLIDNLDYNPDKLNEIEKRLQLIFGLEKKYGPEIEDILNFAEKAKKELNDIESKDVTPENLIEEIAEIENKMKILANQIHQIRLKTGNTLSKNVKAQLKDLYMDKAEFEVQINTSNDFLETGTDIVSFKLKTNPGEDFKSLVKIASGGELSRIMLAMESIMSSVLEIGTVVFDEIDTGVSGRVAQAIANKIYLIAQNIQVLCITHLPQVAAMSNVQLYIKKTATDKKTTTAVSKLNEDERIDVIAQMLSGTKVTILSKKNAKELLELADEKKHLLIQ